MLFPAVQSAHKTQLDETIGVSDLNANAAAGASCKLEGGSAVRLSRALIRLAARQVVLIQGLRRAAALLNFQCRISSIK